MRLQKLLSGLLVLVFAAGATGAWAHDVRTRVGVYFGPSVYWGSPWPGPYYYPYYPPQVVVVPAPQPPVYIEQNEPAESAKQPSQYWYYCKSSKGYYPYVKECPDGWQKVLPQPEK